ncbi:MAG: tetratricopeptide repeat protein [Cyanobacteria bacterium]|nr:tetratricopeptide repeat protein [Cyanobacteriota bacterium]
MSGRSCLSSAMYKNKLANFFYNAKRFEEAQRCYEDCSRLYTTCRPVEGYGDNLHSLAHLYDHNGDVAAANNAFEQSLKMRISIFGKGNYRICETIECYSDFLKRRNIAITPKSLPTLPSGFQACWEDKPLREFSIYLFAFAILIRLSRVFFQVLFGRRGIATNYASKLLYEKFSSQYSPVDSNDLITLLLYQGKLEEADNVSIALFKEAKVLHS